MTKASAWSEATSLDGTEDILIIQSSTSKRVGVDTFMSTSNSRWTGWIYPYTSGWVGTAGQPLTSTSWDGDAHSTTAKTSIDLSAVFGVPAGVKAVSVYLQINDSASSTTDCFIYLSPNNTAYSGFALNTGKATNDYANTTCFIVPCDANGDIYYQITASGTGTFDVIMQIWGYCL